VRRPFLKGYHGWPRAERHTDEKTVEICVVYSALRIAEEACTMMICPQMRQFTSKCFVLQRSKREGLFLMSGGRAETGLGRSFDSRERAEDTSNHPSRILQPRL
jgi:hypothetical protein